MGMLSIRDNPGLDMETIFQAAAQFPDAYLEEEAPPLEDEPLEDNLVIDTPGIGELRNQDTKNILKLAIDKLRDRSRSTRSRGKIDVYITAEDFEEGAERDAFLLIYGSAWDLFEGDQPAARKLALAFFFCASDLQLTFDDAIMALGKGIRPDIFRARLMTEFWLRERDALSSQKQVGHWVMPHLGFSARPLPDAFERLVMAHCFDVPREALALACEIWVHPGIDEATAISRATDRLLRQGVPVHEATLALALELLLSGFLVSPAGVYGKSNLYFTAKNPILELGDTPAARIKLNHGWTQLF